MPGRDYQPATTSPSSGSASAAAAAIHKRHSLQSSRPRSHDHLLAKMTLQSSSLYLRHALLLITSLLLFLPQACHSMPYFVLEEGGKRCFVEEVPSDVLIVGQYRNLDWRLLSASYVEGSSSGNRGVGNIFVHVRDPQQALIVEHQTVENGRFAFTSSLSGEHVICFSFQRDENAQIASAYGYTQVYRVELLLDFGEQARDYTSLAKAEHLSAIEVEVRKLNDKIKSIRSEQDYQKQREAVFRDASEDLNTAVAVWSIVQTVILMIAGLSQLYLLTRFFKSKKLA